MTHWLNGHTTVDLNLEPDWAVRSSRHSWSFFIDSIRPDRLLKLPSGDILGIQDAELLFLIYGLANRLGNLGRIDHAHVLTSDVTKGLLGKLFREKVYGESGCKSRKLSFVVRDRTTGIHSPTSLLWLCRDEYGQVSECVNGYHDQYHGSHNEETQKRCHDGFKFLRCR
jgi:hypothetical protein